MQSIYQLHQIGVGVIIFWFLEIRIVPYFQAISLKQMGQH